MLGRCRRSVVVFDNRRPRNASSHALHGYLILDGGMTPPGMGRAPGYHQAAGAWYPQ